jgi:hypothetical protein
MRARPLAAAVLVLASLGAHAAFAKAPKETPTVEDLNRAALAAIEEKKRRDIEAAKDPLKDAIEAYRDKKTPLAEYQKLVDIINDAKTESVQPYRATAAQALVMRFSREDDSDPPVKIVRRQIALALLDLMKANKDDVGLAAIEQILGSWWRLKMFEFKFKVSDKLDSRKKAYAKMKNFLEKGEN